MTARRLDEQAGANRAAFPKEIDVKRIVVTTFSAALGLASSLGLGACGADRSTQQDFIDASPSYETLSMDVASGDEATPAGVTALTSSVQAAPDAAMMGDGACHPHLFVRTHEVVGRVNRHLFRLVGRLGFLTKQQPTTTTDTTRVWEHQRADGTSVRYTMTRAGEVFSWTLELKGTGDYVLVASGHVDRTSATAPGEGVGSATLDLDALATVVPDDHVSGTLQADFERTATSRKLEVTASDVRWQVDATMPDGSAMSGPLHDLLQQPRNAHYVYFKEPGKGGSLKVTDQMVFLCPANPELKLADVNLVHRWYLAGDMVRHGRSDGKVTGGQLPSTPNLDRIVAVTCHAGQTESYWMMKGEDASGATLSGTSYESTTSNASACDSAFGPVPSLDNALNDYDFAGIDFGDGSVVPFPGML